MAKLYGLANYLMSEIIIRLLNNKEFTKYTYENLEQYNDARNGARGYIFTGKIDFCRKTD